MSVSNTASVSPNKAPPTGTATSGIITTTTASTTGGRPPLQQQPQQQQSQQQQQHVEDLLPRTWRAVSHYLVLIASRAEKCALSSSSSSTSASNTAAAAAAAAATEELNEATRNFLFNRLEWGKSISYLEAKIEGKAAEMESLQHYVRTQPTLGKSCHRKRKLPTTATISTTTTAEDPPSSKVPKTA